MKDSDKFIPCGNIRMKVDGFFYTAVVAVNLHKCGRLLQSALKTRKKKVKREQGAILVAITAASPARTAKRKRASE